MKNAAKTTAGELLWQVCLPTITPILTYRNTTLFAKILKMKPPLTRSAPVMEVTLTPNLPQATEARGATGEKSKRHGVSDFSFTAHRNPSKCETMQS